MTSGKGGRTAAGRGTRAAGGTTRAWAGSGVGGRAGEEGGVDWGVLEGVEGALEDGEEDMVRWIVVGIRFALAGNIVGMGREWDLPWDLPWSFIFNHQPDIWLLIQTGSRPDLELPSQVRTRPKTQTKCQATRTGAHQERQHTIRCRDGRRETRLPPPIGGRRRREVVLLPVCHICFSPHMPPIRVRSALGPDQTRRLHA